MRAALWRSQRGAEPPRARSGEACGARGTGRSLRRGEAARRPTGTHRARPCSGRGGGAGGYPPPTSRRERKRAARPAQGRPPHLRKTQGFVGACPPCSFGGGAPKLYKSPFCVGAGGRGRRGGWGPVGPGWGAAPICTEGAGRLGEPGSPSGPRRKTGGALPVSSEESQRIRPGSGYRSGPYFFSKLP